MADTLTLSKSGGTVAIGCKLPQGLEIFLEKEIDGPPDINTGKQPKVWVKDGARIVLNGTNAEKNGGRVIGGYGFTEVPADAWDRWHALHQDFAPLTAGLIIVGKRTADARAEAKEKAEIMGIERIDPDHPERHNGPDTPENASAENYEGKPESDE